MPFMDWRLVTHVFSLPDSAKVSNGVSKFVAREAMRGRMPESIRAATSKIGFNSPMTAWMNDAQLSQWSLDLFAHPHPLFDGIVDTPALVRRLQELTAHKAWTWESVGRLWPYINLRWYLNRHG